MLRRVAIYARPDRREALELAREAYRRLREAGAEAFYDASIAGLVGGPSTDVRFDDVDGVVVIGGDGTLLRLLQLLGSKTPVLHLVRLGRKAFFFDEEPGEALDRIGDFVAGHFEVEQRVRLHVEVQGVPVYAFNEAAVLGSGSKILVVRVRAGDDTVYERLEGDGLIVATPMGSTAYSYSAGGPVLYLDLDAVVLTPVNPLDRRYGSVVVPGRPGVEVELIHATRPAKLIVDGVYEKLLSRGAVVRACLCGPPVRIARYRGVRRLRTPWS
ncbi:NAD(+)/NADH kinase [Hyperthermus butylicus]|uniref:NAD kinase n=1 Tax=Hyperthermus butylicus (strain DSM 5456 / JCM 9403 / PLM1-5) TaxID=415426 RepID=A2BKR3_HYPBU|nr:NAD(+)/NADH kinase [Hyperthermus butylicus]ABM80575.1 ATP-NAD kinase [Hyperthermus butylicus DSM 5456]